MAVDAANVAETALGLAALTMVLVKLPLRLESPIPVLADRAYDCDWLREHLKKRGLYIVAKHRSNRVKAATSDGRRERRLKRRWKIERSNAWLHSYRRALTRYEKKVYRFEGFVSLACAFIALGKLI
ncbi:IS5/IS1182 family transposase [soil metagenome]